MNGLFFLSVQHSIGWEKSTCSPARDVRERKGKLFKDERCWRRSWQCQSQRPPARVLLARKARRDAGVGNAKICAYLRGACGDTRKEALGEKSVLSTTRRPTARTSRAWLGKVIDRESKQLKSVSSQHSPSSRIEVSLLGAWSGWRCERENSYKVCPSGEELMP